jgi:hypothetical protein
MQVEPATMPTACDPRRRALFQPGLGASVFSRGHAGELADHAPANHMRVFWP